MLWKQLCNWLVTIYLGFVFPRMHLEVFPAELTFAMLVMVMIRDDQKNWEIEQSAQPLTVITTSLQTGNPKIGDGFYIVESSSSWSYFFPFAIHCTLYIQFGDILELIHNLFMIFVLPSISSSAFFPHWEFLWSSVHFVRNGQRWKFRMFELPTEASRTRATDFPSLFNEKSFGLLTNVRYSATNDKPKVASKTQHDLFSTLDARNMMNMDAWTAKQPKLFSFISWDGVQRCNESVEWLAVAAFFDGFQFPSSLILKCQMLHDSSYCRLVNFLLLS